VSVTLGIIATLLNELDQKKISYCLWKSNASIEKGLDGKEDLDLLVDRRDRHEFEAILATLRFKKANVTSGEVFPSVYHYYGLDEKTGVIVHLHLYYRIITGESLLKNYRLPVEDMFFENTTSIRGVRIPRKEAELIVFVIRVMLKHVFLVERVLLYVNQENLKKELDWLLQDTDKKIAANLLEKWLPGIGEGLFLECVGALESKHSLLKRIILARRVRSCLRSYARYSQLQAVLYVNYRFLKAVCRRFILKERNKIPASGGLMIAIVGPEASGKSTIAAEVSQWLGKDFLAYSIHVGKPPSSFISFIPNLFLPFLRKVLPQSRTSEIESRNKRRTSLLTVIRCVMIAFDRRRLILRAYRQVSRGAMVICDRYPSCTIGAMDSPRLNLDQSSNNGFSLKKMLSEIERKMYKTIPSPDIVLKLTVPVDIAVRRNRERIKEGKETEEYVRRRYDEAQKMVFEKAHVYKLNTNQSIEATILSIKKIIWSYL
jgi:thymidylate kinase